MVSAYTPNVGFELPARGDYVGTWDTPVNANETIADLILGGQTTISGAVGNVVLAAAQFQCKTITFNSTLLASITVTFPTSFTKSYQIYNQCTGSSAFTITLQTTVASAQYVCAPPGEIAEIINLGGNIIFTNLGRVGSYWDYAGSSVPNWVSGCSIPPYLECDASTFSSATFPVLATILGSTTLPDHRGRVRAGLNRGTGRLSSANGVDGNTIFAGGGTDSITLATSQIPAHSHGVTDPGHFHQNDGGFNGTGGTVFYNYVSGGFAIANQTPSAVTGITINSAGGGASHANVQPTLVGGIVMIRAG